MYNKEEKPRRSGGEEGRDGGNRCISPACAARGRVTKQFGSLVALDGIDFDVPRHAIISRIGPNGAGKTIFFNILSGIHKPDSGAIWFDGQSLLGRPPHAIAALGLARTFQNSRLFANMTVLENVLVGRHSLRLQAGFWGGDPAALWRCVRKKQRRLSVPGACCGSRA